MFNFLKRKPEDGDVRYVTGQFQRYRDGSYKNGGNGIHSGWFCIDEAITGKIERTVKKLLCEHKDLRFTGATYHSLYGKDDTVEFRCNDCGELIVVPHVLFPAVPEGKRLTPKQRNALIDLGVIKKPELKMKKT